MTHICRDWWSVIGPVISLNYKNNYDSLLKHINICLNTYCRHASAYRWSARPRRSFDGSSFLAGRLSVESRSRPSWLARIHSARLDFSPNAVQSTLALVPLIWRKQGKSEGFDSCNQSSNLAQINWIQIFNFSAHVTLEIWQMQGPDTEISLYIYI